MKGFTPYPVGYAGRRSSMAFICIHGDRSILVDIGGRAIPEFEAFALYLFPVICNVLL